MRTNLGFDICEGCGRHGCLYDADTGERLEEEVFSQNAAIRIVEKLNKEGEVDYATLMDFQKAIRRSILPVEDPDGLPELIKLDDRIIACTKGSFSEDEIAEGIHGFLEEYFPERATQ